MQKLAVLAVGKLGERWMRDACAEYEKRLSGRCGLSVTELEEYRLPSEPSAAQVEQALRKEAEALRGALPPRAFSVALCIEGNSMSSTRLARLLSEKAMEYPSAAFLIGSSHGLDASLKAEVDLRLSFSPMTFPHQLARVMLLEQLYRCSAILSGGKYHK